MATGCRSPVLWLRAGVVRTGKRKRRKLALADPGAGRAWPCGSRAGETPGRARERRPAPLPRRQATAALKAADLAARRPAGPKGKHTPTRPPRPGKGALRRAHPDEPHLFRRSVETFHICSRRRLGRSEPLFWKEASCSGIFCWGDAARAARRLAGACGARWARAGVVVGIGIGAIGSAYADPSVVLPNGLPVQVHPTFPEPGLPAFSFPTGGSSTVGESTSGGDTSGGSGSTGSSGGSTSGSGNAYNLMMSQDWGSQAADAAAAMGVSAAALAATCEMELQCQNTGGRAGRQRDGRVSDDQLHLYGGYQWSDR